MSASWVTVLVALVVALGGAAAWLLREGRREGKLDAILERLTDIATDHEQRMRQLEKRR